MPQQAWSEKRERQYEHIKEGVLERGEDEETAEEIAHHQKRPFIPGQIEQIGDGTWRAWMAGQRSGALAGPAPPLGLATRFISSLHIASHSATLTVACKMQVTKRSTCPAAGALDLIGDRWTMLIVRDLLRGRDTYGNKVGRSGTAGAGWEDFVFCEVGNARKIRARCKN